MILECRLQAAPLDKMTFLYPTNRQRRRPSGGTSLGYVTGSADMLLAIWRLHERVYGYTKKWSLTNLAIQDMDNPTTEGIHQHGRFALLCIRQEESLDANVLDLPACKAYQCRQYRDCGNVLKFFGNCEKALYREVADGHAQDVWDIICDS